MLAIPPNLSSDSAPACAAHGGGAAPRPPPQGMRPRFPVAGCCGKGHGLPESGCALTCLLQVSDFLWGGGLWIFRTITYINHEVTNFSIARLTPRARRFVIPQHQPATGLD